MVELRVEALSFSFPSDWRVAKFDDWKFYRNHFQKLISGVKACDLIAVDSDSCLWLIEVKDYRQHPRTKSITLDDELAGKVLSTLAALLPASLNANDQVEAAVARHSLTAKRVRVVLHIEQPQSDSRLFRRPINPANVLAKLKRRLKCVDPHPKIVDSESLHGLAWSVR